MSESTREINLTPEFLDGLVAIQAYHSQFDAARGGKSALPLLSLPVTLLGLSPTLIPGTQFANILTGIIAGQFLGASTS